MLSLLLMRTWMALYRKAREKRIESFEVLYDDRLAETIDRRVLNRCL
jgi:hypothetical protein